MSFLSKIILAIAVVISGSLQVSAQEHFIGEDQSVNRVIRLQSQAAKSNPAARVAKKVTSRVSEAKRATTPVASPTQIQFDEIKVPQQLKAPMNPVVQGKSTATIAPTTQAPRTQMPRTQAPQNSFRPPSQRVATPTTPNTQMPAMPKRTAPAISAKSTAPRVTNTFGIPVQQQGAKKGQVPNLISSTAASAIKTEIKSPKFVNVGQPAMFQINVVNEGKQSVNKMVLRTTLPSHAKLISASPQPMNVGENTYEFSLTDVGSRNARRVDMHIVPEDKKTLQVGTEIVIENTQSTTVAVRQPALNISLNGSLQGNIGQTLEHEVIVTNIGDGVATDVRLETAFPEALREMTQSTSPVIRRIDPGQSVKVKLVSLAQKAGETELKVVARSKGLKDEQASLGINVYQPELRISAIGPKLNFVQRDGIYTVSIENTGEVDVTGVTVALDIPAGMSVKTINREANIDTERGILTWAFDEIARDSIAEIHLKATALEEGNQVCRIMVKSNETRDKEIQLATAVTTRADMSIRVRNESGPVQVGGKAQFVVEVENKGSRRAEGIAVNVKLPETLNAVEDENTFGATPGTLMFTESAVAPGQTIKFKFSAIGVTAGEHVVRGLLESNNSARQMIAEDTIYIYEVDEARVSESASPAVIERR
jgi:uncharacterized membrane protein